MGEAAPAHQRRTARGSRTRIAEKSPATPGSRTTEESGEGRFARGMGRTIGGNLTNLAAPPSTWEDQSSHLAAVLAMRTRCRKQFALERGLRSSRTRQAPRLAGRTSTKDIMSRARAVSLTRRTPTPPGREGDERLLREASDVGGAMQNAGCSRDSRGHGLRHHAGRHRRWRAPGPGRTSTTRP